MERKSSLLLVQAATTRRAQARPDISAAGCTAHSTAAAAVSETKIVVGTLVKARYKGKERRYPGIVTKVNENGTFSIEYNDGDQEENVQPELVQVNAEAYEEAAVKQAHIESQRAMEAAGACPRARRSTASYAAGTSDERRGEHNWREVYGADAHTTRNENLVWNDQRT